MHDTRDIPPRPGPHHPVVGTPPRAAGSTRRTASVDVSFPHGIDGPVTADVRGQDVRTDADGTAEIIDAVGATFTIDPNRGEVVTIDRVAGNDPLDALIGLPMRGGFARRLIALLPEESASRSLRYSTLENLGGAYLVSGYAGLRTGAPRFAPEHADLAADMQADVCIGWGADASVIATIRTTGENPVPYGPAAPALEGDDPLGWHDLAPLAPTSVRRRRRTDVRSTRDDGLQVEHHFRDTYADTDTEQVMHEYLLEATFDAERQLTALEVQPRVLPWRECPGAVPSAQRIVGVTLDDITTQVRALLTGATTCTHLNSTLHALADVRALALTLAR